MESAGELKKKEEDGETEAKSRKLDDAYEVTEFRRRPRRQLTEESSASSLESAERADQTEQKGWLFNATVRSFKNIFIV